MTLFDGQPLTEEEVRARMYCAVCDDEYSDHDEDGECTACDECYQFEEASLQP
jgi:Zn finger protein HypA/HybF involved in hydrogenase expression